MRPRAPSARARRRAARLMWTSCPQAWQIPSWTEAQGRPVRSSTGSASRSARRATRYAASRGPRSATRPVPGSGRTRMPAASRWRATSVVVRVSVRASSGWACRSRRTSSSSRASPSTVELRASVSKEGSTRPADYPAAPRIDRRHHRRGGRATSRRAQVRPARPLLLSSSTTALTSWARARVVTSTASGVSTTTTSSSPSTATVRPDAGTTSPRASWVRTWSREPRTLTPGQVVAVGDQASRGRRSRPRRPSRRRRGPPRPGRRPRRARPPRGRSRSSSAPATAPSSRVGLRPRCARRPRGELRLVARQQVQQHRRPDDEHPGVPAVLARRELGAGRRGVRLLDELADREGVAARRRPPAASPTWM